MEELVEMPVQGKTKPRVRGIAETAATIAVAAVTTALTAATTTAVSANPSLRQRMEERTERGEIYTYQHEGKTYRWDVSAAFRLLLDKPREPERFRPSDQGVDIHHLLDRYPDLDVDYALTCDTSLPLLFVPFAGCAQLIDGWHRLARALIDEEVFNGAEMPAFLLTQEEADSVMIPPTPAQKGKAGKTS